MQLDASNIEAPRNIRQMIERNLERLTADEQGVLQTASVAGAEFSAASIAAAVDRPIAEVEECCLRLSRHEQFVTAQGTSEWPDGTVASSFRFHHALYGDVLYGRLPAGHRVVLHHRIAEREETAWGAGAAGIAGGLAHHFGRGGDKPKALKYMDLAGERAAAQGAYREAAQHYSDALAILQTMPESGDRDRSELTLQLALAYALAGTRGPVSAETVAAYARAKILAERVGGAESVQALYGQWFTAEIQGEHRVALALADQMLEIARGVGGSGPLTIGHYAQAGTRHYLGDLAGAGQHFQRTIDHSRDAELRDIPVDLRVFVLSISGRNEWHLGHPDQARRGVADAIALARRLNNSFSVAWAAIGALLVSMFCRDFKGVLVACDELLRVNTAMGFPPFNAMTTIWSAWARAQMGEVGGAVERIRQGLAELDAMKWSLGLNVFLMMLGETQGLAGAIHHALVTVEQALRTGSEELIYRPAVLLVRGELQLRKDSGSKAQLEAAEQDFREAIALARDMGAKSSELRATTSVARLLAKQGHRGEARTMLAEIYNWFTEGFDTADLKDAKALLDELRTSHSSLRSGPSLRHGALPRTLPLAWRQL